MRILLLYETVLLMNKGTNCIVWLVTTSYISKKETILKHFKEY